MRIDDLIQILERLKEVSNQGYDHIWGVVEFDIPLGIIIETCRGFKEINRGGARSKGTTKTYKVDLHYENNQLDDWSIEETEDDYL